jgi:hypothetical protein
MIPFIHPSPFAEASLHFLIALVLSGEKPPCGAEPRIELGPALQQAGALRKEDLKSLAGCHEKTAIENTVVNMRKKTALQVLGNS